MLRPVPSVPVPPCASTLHCALFFRITPSPTMMSLLCDRCAANAECTQNRREQQRTCKLFWKSCASSGSTHVEVQTCLVRRCALIQPSPKKLCFDKSVGLSPSSVGRHLPFFAVFGDGQTLDHGHGTTLSTTSLFLRNHWFE